MSNKLVYVVDDEKDIRELISINLKTAGYKVVEFSDGSELLKNIELLSEKPGVIIMDVMMPKIDGFTACSILKKNEKYKDIPIVFLTIKSQISDIETGFKSGGDGYIVKPFSVNKVIEKITSIINKRT